MQKYKKFITPNTNNRKKLTFLFSVSVLTELSLRKKLKIRHYSGP
jgi:hypothetical protein